MTVSLDACWQPFGPGL